MTQKNVYGVAAVVGYNFKGWTWDGAVPENLIELLSIQAGQTILEQMAEDVHIWLIQDDDDIPAIEFSCFDGHVRFTFPLPEIIDQWLLSRAGGEDDDIHPDDARPLLEALEQAAETIRARTRGG